MPLPVSVPLGPLDSVTPESRLPTARQATLGVRVRDVANLVPDPARPGGAPATGYAVPAPAVEVQAESGMVAAFDSPTGEGFYLASGPGQVQGARLGRGALFLARETADGKATPLVRVGVDGSEGAFQPAVPVVDYSATSSRPLTGARGIRPGRYGLRFAYAYEDGSMGPATGPMILSVAEPTAAYAVRVDAAVNDTSLVLDGGVAAATYNNYTDAYPEGVPFVVTAGSARTTVSVIGADVNDDGDSVMTLADPLPAGVEAGAPADYLGRAVVTFTRGAADAYADVPTAPVKGVVVLLTSPLYTAEDVRVALFERPYFVSGTLGLAAGSTVRIGSVRSTDNAVSETSEGDSSGQVYAEGHLGAHGILARRVAHTAGRLLVGGLALDLARPTLPHTAATGAYEFLLKAVVRTDAGPVVRWSEPEAHGDTLTLTGPVSYPDARAETLEVYARETALAGPYKRLVRYQMTPALTQNAAYSTTRGSFLDVDSLALENASGPDAPDAAARAADNAVLDDDPGRILLTGFARPYEMLAERLSSPGPAGQRVQGFAAYGGALSYGQFGEYPVVCFFDRSVFAAAFTDDGELARWRPVEQERGAVGPQAFAVHSSGVFYLASDGLYLLTASGGVSQRLSDPVQRLSGARALGPVLAPSPASCVGVYDDGVRLETWIGGAGTDGGPAQTWVYSLSASTQDVPRWGRLLRARSFFLPAQAPDVGLYGIDAATGRLFAETDTAAERGDTLSLVTAGVESAGGSAAVLARMNTVTDLACPVLLRLYEDAPTDAAPGERPDDFDTAFFSAVLQPDQRFDMRLGSRTRRFSVRLDTDAALSGSPLAPRVGDRLLSFVFATRGPVRSRRAQLQAT